MASCGILPRFNRLRLAGIRNAWDAALKIYPQGQQWVMVCPQWISPIRKGACTIHLRKE
jgi:hypothetical protein